MKRAIKVMARRESIARFFLRSILVTLSWVLNLQARRNPAIGERLRQKDLIVQIKLRDNSLGRAYTIRNGSVASSGRIHPKPDVTLFFENTSIALEMLVPPRDQLPVMSAMKSFLDRPSGSGRADVSWFMETLSLCS